MTWRDIARALLKAFVTIIVMVFIVWSVLDWVSGYQDTLWHSA